MGILGVALAFGLSLLVAAYAIGSISGCHINPAVTVGLWIIGKTKTKELPFYLVGQVVGGIVGALVIFIIASGLAWSRPLDRPRPLQARPRASPPTASATTRRAGSHSGW